MTELITIEIRDNIGILTLNRPEKHNAINDEMGDALDACSELLYEDSAARVILLCGNGPSFCTGRDVSVLGRRAKQESDFDFVRKFQDRRLRQLDCPKPLIAAIQGHVIGGGLEFALAADMRVAASDLTLSLPEINYGLLPDTGGTVLLTSLAGPSKAKYLVLSGKSIAADQALAWGIVDWVVEPDRLFEAAFAIARDIAKASPLNLAMGKQLVNMAWSERIRLGMRAELTAQTALFNSADYREARTAIKEKREPNFSGR